MSTYWAVKCRQCDVDCRERGDDWVGDGWRCWVARVLLDLAPALAAIGAHEESSIFTVSVGYPDVSLEWFRDHAGHELFVISEHGEEDRPTPAANAHPTTPPPRET